MRQIRQQFIQLKKWTGIHKFETQDKDYIMDETLPADKNDQ